MSRREMYTVQPMESPQLKRERESIHSGQFMVSHFEAEEQDDEDEVAVPIPEVPDDASTTIVPVQQFSNGLKTIASALTSQQQLYIDTSLAKLFQCMSLAYRQKLTSPKWNRFRGIRLRWKDKIRLNNVIWRCWHLQFIRKQNTPICQFASPLDVDTHNKPEAVVLEGKYWKRKLAAVTAEYKKWRMFFRNHASGQSIKDDIEMLSDGGLIWNSQSNEDVHMMVDEDYMGLMSDTLFTTITNQPFVFPDSREIARAGLAEFIQPSLGPLQPNIEDYMDTFDPLQDFMIGKLPTVPEEQTHTTVWTYSDLDLMTQPPYQQQNLSLPDLSLGKSIQQETVVQTQEHLYGAGSMLQQTQTEQYNIPPPPPYHATVISKNAKSQLKQQQIKLNQTHPIYNKSVYNATGYGEQNSGNICVTDQQLQSQCELVQDQRHVQQQQQQQQQQYQQTSNIGQFKVPQDQRQSSGYKFSSPSPPNLKFTSHQVPHMMLSAHSQYNTVHSLPKEDKSESRLRTSTRGRPRSRSNTREPISKPPLTSAVSDPALLSQFNNVTPSVLQLLTTNRNDKELLINRGQVRIKEENSPVPILPQPPPTTLIITTPAISAVQSSCSDPLLLNSFSSSNSPILDSASQSVNSPTSSQGSLGSPHRDGPHRDQKRVGHIHAEQKRRYNIKTGFDMLHTLIPQLNQNPNAKLSKAAMLHKGAEYIRQLRSERSHLHEEMECLKQQIETLNTSISNCQSMLPATGAPVSRRRDSKMQEMFDDYVRKRTMENWKYWIFSLLFRPLLGSFNNFVSTSSLDELYRTTMQWIEQHCTLGDLRPVVLNSLKYLSTRTEILNEPEKLPDEARQMALSPNNQK